MTCFMKQGTDSLLHGKPFGGSRATVAAILLY